MAKTEYLPKKNLKKSLDIAHMSITLYKNKAIMEKNGPKILFKFKYLPDNRQIQIFMIIICPSILCNPDDSAAAAAAVSLKIDSTEK